MNLYIDIDGVLLGKLEHQLKLANGVQEFLEISLATFECYWLTTHCKGNAQTALSYLQPYCNSETMHLLRSIEATDFDVLKTDAINFEEEFIWLDDFLLQSEMDVLEKNECLHAWHQVNTYKNINELKEFTERYLSQNKRAPYDFNSFPR